MTSPSIQGRGHLHGKKTSVFSDLEASSVYDSQTSGLSVSGNTPMALSPCVVPDSPEGSAPDEGSRTVTSPVFLHQRKRAF